MPLNAARFNQQLRTMGQAMTWSRASKCPCADPQTGGAVSTCPVCRGRGALWAAPVGSRAGLSGMKIQREWANFGQWESGDVVVSVGSDQPLYGAGELDRVVFVQSSEAFDSVLARGSPGEWRGFLPSTSSTVGIGTPNDQTFFGPGPATDNYPLLSFDRCFWLDDTGSSIVEGGLPALQSDGTLAWAAGALAPPTGRQYTLRGRKRPEYFLFKDFAQDRAHFGGMALPRRLVLRRWDLFAR